MTGKGASQTSVPAAGATDPLRLSGENVSGRARRDISGRPEGRTAEGCRCDGYTLDEVRTAVATADLDGYWRGRQEALLEAMGLAERRGAKATAKHLRQRYDEGAAARQNAEPSCTCARQGLGPDYHPDEFCEVKRATRQCADPGPKPADYEWPVGSGKWITHYVNHGGTWQGRERTPGNADRKETP